MAMNWPETLNYFLGKGRVNRAAIFDGGGKPLAATEDVQIPDQEALTLIKCVNIPVNVYDRSQFGLFIGQIRYICFKVDDRTVVGLTKEELFVAHRCDNVMILAFVTLKEEQEVTRSCLGEVWTFAQELKSRMDVSHFVQ